MLTEVVCPTCGFVSPVIIDDCVYCGDLEPPTVFCINCNGKYEAGVDTMLEVEPSVLYKVYENGQSD